MASLAIRAISAFNERAIMVATGSAIGEAV
jgi:hypothetical protein